MDTMFRDLGVAVVCLLALVLALAVGVWAVVTVAVLAGVVTALAGIRSVLLHRS